MLKKHAENLKYCLISSKIVFKNGDHRFNIT